MSFSPHLLDSWSSFFNNSLSLFSLYFLFCCQLLVLVLVLLPFSSHSSPSSACPLFCLSFAVDMFTSQKSLCEIQNNHRSYSSLCMCLLCYESFIKDLGRFFIYSFITTEHRGKIFPKKEIEIKVVDLP